MAARSLDLHGARAEEVIPKVDEFLTQATAAGFDQVKIVTGKGTGKVKSIVVDYLRKARYPWHHEKNQKGVDNEGVIIVPM